MRRLFLEPEPPLLAIEVRRQALAAVRLVREGSAHRLAAAACFELPEGVLELSLARPNVIDPAGFRRALQSLLERVGGSRRDGSPSCFPTPSCASPSLPPERRRPGGGRRWKSSCASGCTRRSPSTSASRRSPGPGPSGGSSSWPRSSSPCSRATRARSSAWGSSPGLVEPAGLALLAARRRTAEGDRLLVNWDDGYVSLVVARAGWPLVVRTLSGGLGAEARGARGRQHRPLLPREARRDGPVGGGGALRAPAPGRGRAPPARSHRVRPAAHRSGGEARARRGDGHRAGGGGSGCPASWGGRREAAPQPRDAALSATSVCPRCSSPSRPRPWCSSRCATPSSSRTCCPDRVSALDREALALEQELRRLREEAARLRGPRPEPERVKQWASLRALVDQRAFSWTTLLASLEDVLPDGVRLVSIAPLLKDGRVTLEITAVARQFEDRHHLLRALDESPEFEDVFLRTAGDSEHGEEFTYTTRYLPGGGVAARGAGPARGSRGRGSPDRSDGRDEAGDVRTPDGRRLRGALVSTAVLRPAGRRRLLVPVLVLLGLNVAVFAAYTLPRTLQVRRATSRTVQARAEVEKERKDVADAQRARGRAQGQRRGRGALLQRRGLRARASWPCSRTWSVWPGSPG